MSSKRQWERLQSRLIKNQLEANKAYQLIPAYQEKVRSDMRKMSEDFAHTDQMVNKLLLQPIKDVLRKIPWVLTKDRLPIPSRDDVWYEITTNDSLVPLNVRYVSEDNPIHGYFSTDGCYGINPANVIAWRPLMSEIYKEEA